MNKSNEPLDRLISDTLKNIHGRAYQEGLSSSFRSLDSVNRNYAYTHQKIKTRRARTSSLLAIAASFLLIIGLGLPVLISNQEGGISDDAKRLQSASKVSTTTKTNTDPDDDKNATTTTNPLVSDDDTIPTTTAKGSPPPNTSPFYPSPSPTPTTPAVVNQLARVSYSNTRANDIPLDGATISGNVYIFIPNTDVYSALWFLDDGGAFEKGTHFRGGKTLPIDFNYRESDRLTPKPFDTSQWSVGEHTLGIETKSISTGKYSKTSIKFYVTR